MGLEVILDIFSSWDRSEKKENESTESGTIMAADES